MGCSQCNEVSSRSVTPEAAHTKYKGLGVFFAEKSARSGFLFSLLLFNSRWSFYHDIISVTSDVDVFRDNPALDRDRGQRDGRRQLQGFTGGVHVLSHGEAGQFTKFGLNMISFIFCSVHRSHSDPIYTVFSCGIINANPEVVVLY